MPTYIKVFLSLASIISGAALLIVSLRYFFRDEAIYQGVFGVILLAAGISSFLDKQQTSKRADIFVSFCGVVSKGLRNPEVILACFSQRHSFQ